MSPINKIMMKVAGYTLFGVGLIGLFALERNLIVSSSLLVCFVLGGTLLHNGMTQRCGKPIRCSPI